VGAEPRDGARTVVAVGLGAAVSGEKLVAAGGWAHVIVGPRVFRYDAPDGEPVPLAPKVFDKRLPQGFIRVADVAATAPSRRALIADGADAANMLRAWSLDPHDDDAGVRRVAAPTAKAITRRRERSPVERADLVFGCSGDITRASIASGTVASLAAQGATRRLAGDDVCIAGLDVRPPCDLDSVAAKRHRGDMARLVPRYGNDGPALRLLVGPGASEQPVWIVTRFLAVDGCVDCSPSASTTEVKVTRLRVPRVEKGTTLLFDVDPRDDEQLAQVGPGAHLYAAPDVCSCAACADVDDPP
jgi:hypothetical protein